MSRVNLFVCRHFQPGALSYSVYHGTISKENQKILESKQVVLTTYETLVSDEKDTGPLNKISWHRVILDEGKY